MFIIVPYLGTLSARTFSRVFIRLRGTGLTINVNVAINPILIYEKELQITNKLQVHLITPMQLQSLPGAARLSIQFPTSNKD